ncbi:low affinity immunoglobulin gamma Fc region receptor II-like [Seriola dumerili]|uniref:low affinity immunoglobulin gamma Fc region receptor II-like n=1 Tax=Seriola dumerili TaxID=41447 RepID=UPI000BBEE3F2|nr:low affinity immunoglobulin gamma Fc region receptor II-like [Seriola dumerili]
MEVTALCIRLLIMLVANAHHGLAEDDDAALARIIPTRLQLFDYSSVSFNCESAATTTGWKVMRKIKGEVSTCVSNWPAKAASVCSLKPVYPTDSGEYWCETGDGERSNAVNITITTGSVILESPVLPVVEGESVTLRCRTKKTSCAHIADFFQDDILIGTGSFGEMTIHSVSKSNEGLYRCSITQLGESPESRLAVTAVHTETRPQTTPSSDCSCHIYLVLRTGFTVLMVALLLLLVGRLHCGKLKVTHSHM